MAWKFVVLIVALNIVGIYCPGQGQGGTPARPTGPRKAQGNGTSAPAQAAPKKTALSNALGDELGGAQLRRSTSRRANRGLVHFKNAQAAQQSSNAGPYHPRNNPDGVISLDTADNVLSADLIGNKFDSLDWNSFPKKSLMEYPRAGGEISTQKIFADFINTFSPKGATPDEKIPANELMLVPGVTSGIDLLAQAIFDHGDYVLVPSPFYFRFTNDFYERGMVNIGAVPSLSVSAGKQVLSVQSFENVYKENEKKKKGIVKAILLTSPQNPEGGYFSLAELKPIIEWALAKDLYVILDEIYDLAIYDEDRDNKFQSATKLFKTKEDKQKLIWLWGISKNFSLPGLRTAVLWSPNADVRVACSRFMMITVPNAITQFVVSQFLGDHKWLKDTFFPQNYKRMKAARDTVIAKIDEWNKKGTQVRYVMPRAAFFMLIDFSDFLGGKKDFAAERDLYNKIVEHKVILSAGEPMKAPKAGYFRMVFTCVEAPVLAEALKRIGRAIGKER